MRKALIITAVFFLIAAAGILKGPWLLNLAKIYFGGIKLHELKERLAIDDLEKKFLAPVPLRKEGKANPGVYFSNETIAGITNEFRGREGLAPLNLDETLSEVAHQKANDILEKDYFSHVSPEGQDASDLVNKIGYKFIIIGENLALGAFSDERELVQAWMDSPGHRANILENRFREIGIAATQGDFKGSRVWIAVQIFASPLSVCQEPDSALKQEILGLKSEIEQLKNRIEALRIEIETTNSKSESRRKAEEYNRLVSEYNSLVEGSKTRIEIYNKEAEEFNNCLLEQ